MKVKHIFVRGLIFNKKLTVHRAGFPTVKGGGRKRSVDGQMRTGTKHSNLILGHLEKLKQMSQNLIRMFGTRPRPPILRSPSSASFHGRKSSAMHPQLFPQGPDDRRTDASCTMHQCLACLRSPDGLGWLAECRWRFNSSRSDL